MMKTITPALADFKDMLGSNIRAMRRASGLNADVFAEKIGVSRAHLFNLENALARSIPLRSLLRLSAITDLSRLCAERLNIYAKYRNVSK